MRIALIGDIGGHHDELLGELVRLGMNASTYVLPADLTIVQVGDLIHRGPDTAGVLRLVATIIAAQPTQWVQLAGNHESLLLPNTPGFLWSETLSDPDVALLRRWWDEGTMTVAVALHDQTRGDLLITHAGLTYDAWQAYGAPPSAHETALAINAVRRTAPELTWASGQMLGAHSFAAGPVWAAAGTELYASWDRAIQRGQQAPFHQVHGHSSAFIWNKHAFSCSTQIAALVSVDTAVRHEIASIGGKEFIGIDPALGAHAGVRWRPLLLNGTVLTGPARC